MAGLCENFFESSSSTRIKMGNLFTSSGTTESA
jgi:hypothetical protein